MGLALYALLLMVSGALLLVMGGVLPGQSKFSRLLNVVVGVAFFGYGFYLEFLFSGGSYFILFYAFVVPVVLIVRTFKERNAAKDAAAHQQAQAQAYAAQSQQPPTQAAQYPPAQYPPAQYPPAQYPGPQPPAGPPAP